MSKVYLPAIEGFVPNEIVRTLCALLEFIYIARRNILDTNDIQEMHAALARFHQFREIFVTLGIRDPNTIPPRQHSLMHYPKLIRDFGAPNGLCSSITESEHIRSVKKPWRRSNRYNALGQMLTTNQRLNKLLAVRADFKSCGLLDGHLVNPSKSNNGVYYYYCYNLYNIKSKLIFNFLVAQQNVNQRDRNNELNANNEEPEATFGQRLAPSILLASKTIRLCFLIFFWPLASNY